MISQISCSLQKQSVYLRQLKNSWAKRTRVSDRMSPLQQEKSLSSSVRCCQPFWDHFPLSGKEEKDETWIFGSSPTLVDVYVAVQLQWLKVVLFFWPRLWGYIWISFLNLWFWLYPSSTKYTIVSVWWVVFKNLRKRKNAESGEILQTITSMAALQENYSGIYALRE